MWFGRKKDAGITADNCVLTETETTAIRKLRKYTTVFPACYAVFIETDSPTKLK